MAFSRRILSVFSSLIAKLKFKKQSECKNRDPGIDVLLAIIRIVARGVKGTAFMVSANPSAALILYGTMVPHIFKLVTEYDDICCEIESLNAERYTNLVGAIMLEFGFGSDRAREVIAIAFELVKEFAKETAPKVQDLMEAVHRP